VLEFTAWEDYRENGVILGKNYLKDTKFVKVVGTDAANIQDSQFAENDIPTAAQVFFQSFYSNRELSIYDGSYGKLREAHITLFLPKSLFGTGSFVKGGSVAWLVTTCHICGGINPIFRVSILKTLLAAEMVALVWKLPVIHLPGALV
jgi:hypothetical protein